MEHIPSRTAKQLGNLLTKIVYLYSRGDFVVNVVLMDQEFDKIVDEVTNLDINTTAAREHVREIERVIRTVKERSCAVVSYKPYVVLPKPMVIHILYFSVLMLNKKTQHIGYLSGTLTP